MYQILLARIYYMWGSLHRNFGNKISYVPEHQAAVQRFSRAYQLDPSLRQARLDRGILLYRELGQTDEALADFDALLAEDPKFAPALLNRALLAQECGRYADALLDFEAYLELPAEDKEYRAIALRTAELLREIVTDLPGNSEAKPSS